MSLLATMFPMGAAAKAAIDLISRHANRPDASEFQRVLQQTLGMQLVAQRDTDGNGVLSANEFSGDAALFAAWDVNGDGALTSAEIDNGARLSRKWQLLDSDRDGVLTQHEAGAAPDAFSMMDADNDGTVSRREFHRAYGGGVA